MFEKLGITLQGMLFHLAALIILAVAMYFLLYKPIKKIIAGHNAKLKDIFDENDKLNSDAEELKTKYEGMLSDVKQESARVSAEAAEKAQARADALVSEAKIQAENIIADAENNVKSAKQRLDYEFKKSVEKTAVEIAGKVLEREVSAKDNSEIIDAYLSKWDK